MGYKEVILSSQLLLMGYREVMSSTLLLLLKEI